MQILPMQILGSTARTVSCTQPHAPDALGTHPRCPPPTCRSYPPPQSASQSAISASGMPSVANETITALMSDMVAHAQRFLAQLSLGVQQLLGDIQLPIPSEEIGDIHAAAADYDLVHRLEHVVNEWVLMVQHVIAQASGHAH